MSEKYTGIHIPFFIDNNLEDPQPRRLSQSKITYIEKVKTKVERSRDGVNMSSLAKIRSFFPLCLN